MGCHFLLQGIFLALGLNPHVLHLLYCRQILLPLSYLGSPSIYLDKCKRDSCLHVNFKMASLVQQQAHLFEGGICQTGEAFPTSWWSHSTDSSWSAPVSFDFPRTPKCELPETVSTVGGDKNSRQGSQRRAPPVGPMWQLLGSRCFMTINSYSPARL